MQRLYEYKGKERTIREIAALIGVKQKTLEKRLRLNEYNLSKCLTRPDSVRFKDLTGDAFARWTVLSRGVNTKAGRASWLCKCKCGVEKLVTTSTLINGSSKSCGCLEIELKTVHGLNATRVQMVWENMHERCYNSNCNEYKNYGGRGIRVGWNSIEEFYADMGHPPDKLSLDRKDNNGNYTKANCRWATQSQQARNSRQSRRWFLYGKMYETALDAAEALGVSKSVIRGRCNGYTDRGKKYPPKDECYSEYYYPR